MTHLRFATAEVSYAWGQGPLWLTTNGGAFWQPGGLPQVYALGAAAGLVWTLAGELPYPTISRTRVGGRVLANIAGVLVWYRRGTVSGWR